MGTYSTGSMCRSHYFVHIRLHDCILHIYRPQQSWAKVMFLQASVTLSTGGCVCLSACWDTTPPPPRDQTPPRTDTLPGADTPWSRHPPEQTPPRANTSLGPDTPTEQTPHGTRHPPGPDTPWDKTPPWEQTPPRANPP